MSGNGRRNIVDGDRLQATAVQPMRSWSNRYLRPKTARVTLAETASIIPSQGSSCTIVWEDRVRKPTAAQKSPTKFVNPYVHKTNCTNTMTVIAPRTYRFLNLPANMTGHWETNRHSAGQPNYLHPDEALVDRTPHLVLAYLSRCEWMALLFFDRKQQLTLDCRMPDRCVNEFFFVKQWNASCFG